ncbi:hypothetical protein K0U83_03630, partial [bacterium]|nr:hypothetical protein [bacterium]
MSDLNEAINVSLNVLYVEHCENCDESTGHICEMCFVHETLLKLHAEVERLREALKETAVAAVRCRNRNQT